MRTTGPVGTDQNGVSTLLRDYVDRSPTTPPADVLAYLEIAECIADP